ncbi:hypothetical protein [Bacillus swezeyi]|uniref:Uncharacterized protein n=1 Tax=Bacillus swezeyi TaxID=1925020 RepID=A0A5M8RV36_9BACI|nr:hypothetical protein [Bacillus swezeyi]KAA6450976.1 hypothetical protein DX927_09095 [Bacillus swezeyi]
MENVNVREIINELSTRLGVAAEHVYEVLVKQQVINGIITIAFMVGALILFGIMFPKFLRKGVQHQKTLSSSYDSNPDMNIAWSLGGILLFTIVLSLIFIPIGINQIINPEYYAIKDILDLIKGN